MSTTPKWVNIKTIVSSKYDHYWISVTMLGNNLGFSRKNCALMNKWSPITAINHTAKQFLRGKPIRFGYKNWMLCSSDGYCFSMQPYSGSNKFSDESRKKFPLGSMVVLDLLEALENHKNHELFIDNFFTSYDLLKTLKEKNLRCTGTVRENRLRQPKGTLGDLSKSDRGEFRCASDGDIVTCKWKDCNTVCLASNFETTTPVSKCKRWSKGAKEKIEVNQPKMITAYNKHMGGVDLLDKIVGLYRVRIYFKKWYWRLVNNVLSVAVVKPGNCTLSFRNKLHRIRMDSCLFCGMSLWHSWNLYLIDLAYCHHFPAKTVQWRSVWRI